MLELIMFFVTSASLSILWNGEKLEAFQPKRGLRQGNPLSPYLFVLCMEVLSHRILEKVESKEWKSIKLSHRGPTLSHVFFVDDLFLFGEAFKSQAHLIELVLHDFYGISGQKVNVGKSKLYVSRNTNSAIELAISSK